MKSRIFVHMTGSVLARAVLCEVSTIVSILKSWPTFQTVLPRHTTVHKEIRIVSNKSIKWPHLIETSHRVCGRVHMVYHKQSMNHISLKKIALSKCYSKSPTEQQARKTSPSSSDPSICIDFSWPRKTFYSRWIKCWFCSAQVLIFWPQCSALHSPGQDTLVLFD